MLKQLKDVRTRADRTVVRKTVSLIWVIFFGALPSAANAACQSTSSSAIATIPPDKLALYEHWGAHYNVPWQILAGIGRIESNHGRNPRAYHPHHRGVLGPMQFQAGSNRAALRVDAQGNQGFGGTWALYRAASGNPPYRMDSADDQIAAAAAKVAADAGSARNWRGALLHYNYWRVYVRWVMQKAYLYGYGSVCGGHNKAAVTVGASREANVSQDDLLASRNLRFSANAAADIRGGVADVRLINLLDWISRRHSVYVSVIKTGHAHYVPGTKRPSNHWFGRAATITSVDGNQVREGSTTAKALWRSLLAAPAAVRMTELGAPWTTPTFPRSFSGSEEQASIHIGFDE